MKIALIENKSDEFLNSRLRYALFLKNKGHKVIAILPDDEAAEALQQAGIDTMSLGFDVRERSAKTVLTYIKRLRQIFKQEQFDVIHFYRLQPNLLGTPTAYFSTKKSKIINHITGLGIAFAQDPFKIQDISYGV